MNVDFIRFLGINLCTFYLFFKITAYFQFNKTFSKYLAVTIITIIIAIVEAQFQKYFSTIPIVLISYIIYSCLLSIFYHNNIGYTLTVMAISFSITCIFYFISSILLTVIVSVIPNYNYTNLVNFALIFIVEFILIYFTFKLRRFKYGFSFLKNKNKDNCFDIFILMTCVNIIFIYFIMLNYSNISFKDIFVVLSLFSFIMVLTLYKTFIIYQKQKLLEKTIKEYEQELSEKDAKLETVIKDKNSLVKANHEFYHRQKALNLKLDTLMKSPNLLCKEEYGSIVDRINTLSTEYNEIIATNEVSGVLPKCNISEIDDMFIYLKNECDENDIDFSLRFTCDVYHLVNNIIPKNKLETLIGDLIRNSIIAINYSSNSARAIMVILGIKDNIYEFSIYDTGIEFEIDTLLKLGKECATTHKDNGGTGIGFITTFETLKYCNASLIINEFCDDKFNYTKSITVRFDGENNYIIETYRNEKFVTSSIKRDDLIIKNKS